MVETCEFSRIMNRPCTWTRDIITKRQYKDIVFHPLVQFPATSIPDPECVFDLLESIEGSAVSTRPEDDIAAV